MRRNVRDRVSRAGAVPHLRSGPLHRGRRRWPALLDYGCVHLVGQLSLLDALRSGGPVHQLHAQQRQGGRRRLRRDHDLLCLRQRRSDPGGLSRHLPFPVQGCLGHAGRAAQARALSRVTAQRAGGGVRPLSHDQSGGLLQPRGSCGPWPRKPAGPERRRPSHAAHGAELRADEAARRNRPGVRRDSALHAGQSQQPDRLDRRAQRRRSTTAQPWSTTFPKPGWSTARSRSSRASIRTRSSRGS